MVSTCATDVLQSSWLPKVSQREDLRRRKVLSVHFLSASMVEFEFATRVAAPVGGKRGSGCAEADHIRKHMKT